MQALSGPRRQVVLALAILAVIILIFKFYGEWPVDYYSPLSPLDTATPVEILNDKPQEKYFKLEPEWDWDFPTKMKDYAKTPKPKDVVVLTASDGGGHNSQIQDVLNKVLNDREQYCERHGFQPLWLNTSRYDIGESHRTWSKIPAVAEAFYRYPQAEWVWLLDTDIIMMTPSVSVIDLLLKPAAIEKGLMRDVPILDGQLSKKRTNISTPLNPTVSNIDILITQDHQSVNTGSVFFRRTAFTRWILETMTDKLLMGREIIGAEQDALKHLMLEHPLVREHVGIFPQRFFNAYVQGGNNMGWRDGDLLVHFAGCWVGGKCDMWFEEFWAKKGSKEPWKPEKDMKKRGTFEDLDGV